MLLPIFIALDVLCVAADPTFFGSTAGQAPPPLDPAEIPAPLEGGVAYECVYACDMRKLREMLFAPASPFYSEFMRQMGRDQAVVEPYRKSGNVWERKVTYRAPRTTLVRSNTVYETHSISCPKPGVCVYECEAHTPEVPFGDCFVTRVRQVLASVPALEGQANKEPACLFQASFSVELTRSTMMEGAIHRGAHSGLQSNFMAYAGVLEQRFGVRLAGAEGTPAVAASTKKNLEPVAPIVRPIVRLAKMASAIFTARLLGQQAWQLKRKLVESHSIVQHDA